MRKSKLSESRADNDDDDNNNDHDHNHDDEDAADGRVEPEEAPSKPVASSKQNGGPRKAPPPFVPPVDISAMPDVLVYQASPLGTYVVCREAIEALTGLMPKVREQFAKLAQMHDRRLTTITLVGNPNNIEAAQRRDTAEWTQKVRKCVPHTVPAADPKEPCSLVLPSTPIEELRELPNVYPLSEAAVARKTLVPLTMRDLFSEFVFESTVSEWRKKAGRLTPPAPFDNIQTAWLIDAELPKQSANPDTRLTLDRLERQMHHDFILSRGPHNDRFDVVLVRADSAFYRNVIMAAALSQPGRFLIGISEVYVYTPEKDVASVLQAHASTGQARFSDPVMHSGSVCNDCLEHQVACKHNVALHVAHTNTNKQASSVLYLAVPKDKFMFCARFIIQTIIERVSKSGHDDYI